VGLDLRERGDERLREELPVRRAAAFAWVVGVLGCGGADSEPSAVGATGAGGASSTTAAGGAGGQGRGGAASAGGAGGATSTTAAGGQGGAGGVAAPCPAGVTCVDSFPFHDARDSSKEGTASIGSYACKPSADESGREIVYRVAVPADGFLSAAVAEADGVDVDVHVLSAFDPAAPSGDACLDRGDKHARADVAQGFAWVVVDTYAADGAPQEGAFQLDIGFLEPSRGPCDMEVGEMARVGDGGDHLAMPATGPMVLEAHLVTQEEPAPYPSSATDELAAHYALSQAKTGLVMHRSEPWAPLEGGDFYGCGIGDPADFPVEHEAWYVNMYWTGAARPPKGSRMIVRDPNGGPRAVVVAAGYETGPGDLSYVGGTPEETHFYMRTQHASPMTLGIAKDQALPFGPRVCQ
jgi:hypothetical protein